MIKVHVFFTNSYLKFAELFLKSFRKFNHTSIPILCSTRNLNNENINSLYKLYKNLTIINEEMLFDDIQPILNMTNEQYTACIDLCVNRHRYQKSPVTKAVGTRYKQFIAVNERVRKSMSQAFDWCDEGDVLVHFDADTFINGSLDELFKFMSNYDICIKNNINQRLDHKKFLISLVSFRINYITYEFLDTWHKYIDDVHLSDRTKGYGQASFYYTYKHLKKKISIGDISHLINDRDLNSIVIKSSMLKKFSESKDLYSDNITTFELCERRLEYDE